MNTNTHKKMNTDTKYQVVQYDGNGNKRVGFTICEIKDIETNSYKSSIRCTDVCFFLLSSFLSLLSTCCCFIPYCCATRLGMPIELSEAVKPNSTPAHNQCSEIAVK